VTHVLQIFNNPNVYNKDKDKDMCDF